MVFPSKPVSLLRKLCGDFQQPLRCGSGPDFSFHLRSDWEDADASSGKGATDFISLSAFVGVDGGSLWGWKSLKRSFFSFFHLLLFLLGLEWTGSWGERQLCKWGMPAKMKWFFMACTKSPTPNMHPLTGLSSRMYIFRCWSIFCCYLSLCSMYFPKQHMVAA